MLSRLMKLKNSGQRCSCGKTHSLITDEICVKSGASSELVNYMNTRFKGKIAVICDENTVKYASKLAPDINSGLIILNGNTHADETAVSYVKGELLNKFGNSSLPECFIACGSGSVHDITRYTAHEYKVPFVSYPTAASVDGFVSGVAAMTWHGQKITFPSSSPIAVFADDDVFFQAPYELTASGAGDILGKFTALFDWRVSHILTDEYICDEIENIEYEALNSLVYAVENGDVYSKEFVHTVMECLILSGLAMQLVGNSRPASGCEHHLSHLWEMHCINEPTSALHGEKVGVGTILALEKYYSFERFSLSQLNPNIESVFDCQILQPIFGNLTEGIIKENLPSGKIDSSSLSLIRYKDIDEVSLKIKNLINILPSSEKIKKLTEKFGGKTNLASLGLPDDTDFILRSLRFAPYVRNRLSLMKIITLN